MKISIWICLSFLLHVNGLRDSHISNQDHSLNVADVCVNDCNGHGRCINDICVCVSGYRGSACEYDVEIQPGPDTTNVCDPSCDVHGTCSGHSCICDEGYRGLWCTEGPEELVKKVIEQVEEKEADVEEKLADINEASEHVDDIRDQLEAAKATGDLDTVQKLQNEVSEKSLEIIEQQKNIETLQADIETSHDKVDITASKLGVDLDEDESPPVAVCDNQCQEHGTCKNGHCICDEGYRGLWCTESNIDIEAAKLSEEREVQEEVEQAKEDVEAKEKEIDDLKESLKDASKETRDEIKKEIEDKKVEADIKKELLSGALSSIKKEEESPCNPECEKHGSCVAPGLCECQSGYRGVWCEDLDVTCLNGCNGHGQCIVTDHDYFVCDCNRDTHKAYYGIDCSRLAPFSTVIPVDKTVTSPSGSIVVPSTTGEGTPMSFVTFNDRESGKLRPGIVLNEAERLGLLDTHLIDDKGESIPIRIYDNTALLPSATISQLISDDVASGSSVFSILGPLLLRNNNYVLLGDEVRKIVSISKDQENPSLSQFAVNEPFLLSHERNSLVTQLEVSDILPLSLPQVLPPPCSTDCNAPQGGKCVINFAEGTAACECEPGYNGVTCSTNGCPNLCGGSEQGKCSYNEPLNEYSCECVSGYTGHDCTESNICGSLGGPCENGVCTEDGLCKCEGSWSGDLCTVDQCPNKCNYPNGDCITEESVDGVKGASKCVCTDGYSGLDCGDLEVCPDNCSNHGSCVNDDVYGKACQCDKGFTGRACQEEIECVGNCSDHGKCVLGECECEPEYKGAFCDEKVTCPNECNHAGDCVEGACQCKEGYLGTDCSVKVSCDYDCYGNGECSAGTCYCNPGYTGSYCQTEKTCDLCVSGKCHLGKCFCDLGWEGDFCDVDKRVNCPVNTDGHVCSNVGVCVDAACLCPDGYSGVACDVEKPKCNAECGDHGLCVDDNCSCDPGWRGLDCSIELKCSSATGDECSGHGVCAYGKCYCGSGWTGASCEVSDSTCKCGLHGKCSGGVCVCDDGWEGPQCKEYSIFEDISLCKAGCSGNGVCLGGNICECEPGWTGEACDTIVTCPHDCNDRGICLHGDCFCDPGFTGRSCHEELECPSNRTRNDLAYVNGGIILPEAEVEFCSGHGACEFGQCWCTLDYFGPDCGTSSSMVERLYAAREVPCDNNCNGHGDCYLGQCTCESGFYGPACDITSIVGPCPNGCAGNGVCSKDGEHAGQCLCFSGFVGIDCSKFSGQYLESLTNQCIEFCGSDVFNSHGRCVAGTCVCDKNWGGQYCSEELEVNNQQFKEVNRLVKDSGSLKEKDSNVASGKLSTALTTSCPNDCTVSSTGYSNGFCSNGACVCKAGYGDIDCSVECPNLCSSHGTCAKTPLSDLNGNADTWKCYCQLGWTGGDCSFPAMEKEGMITSSIVIIAIVLFIGGLCIVPTWKAVIDQRKQNKRENIATGDIPEISGVTSYNDESYVSRGRRKLG